MVGDESMNAQPLWADLPLLFRRRKSGWKCLFGNPISMNEMFPVHPSEILN